MQPLLDGRNQRAILELTRATRDGTGNLPPLPAIHPKAMAVLLTRPDEMDTWLGAPWKVAREPRRPLPDGDILIVSKGNRMNPG